MTTLNHYRAGTLRQMASIAIEEAEAQQRAAEQQDEDEHYPERAAWFAEQLQTVLCIVADDHVERRGGFPFFVEDGVTLTVREFEDDGVRDLVVVLPCKDCGQDCTEQVWSLERLGQVLRNGATHHYPQRCAAAAPGQRTDPVEYAIQAVALAWEVYGKAAAAEMALEDGRPVEKAAAILRVLEAKLATSATAAEKIVETDARYWSYRVEQRSAVIDKQKSYGLAKAAELRARRLVQKEAANV